MQSIDFDRERIAAEVRAEMARQGVSTRDLGRLVGMPQQHVQRRVSGKQSFRAEELARFAAALGVPVSQFIPDGVAA